MPNPGFNAGIGQLSKAGRLARALKGAPLRKTDLRLNSVAGIAEGRKLRDRVTGLMRERGANPDDAIVACVFAEPDLSALIPQFAKLGITNGPSDLALATQFVNKLPIGFLIFMWEKEPGTTKGNIFGHVRPLIVEDTRSLDFNSKALDWMERWIRREVLGEGVN
jgi:hypothetical protein